MNGQKDCETCVYLTRTYGEDKCNNAYVRKLRRKASKPDPYDCIFYDAVTDDYISDMDKVRENT